MGGPLHSLRWLVGSLTARGSGLQKGSLVIPGSPVELVTIGKDTELTVEVEDVGVLTANFRKEHQV
jgi:2-keto-4-pentenoate hydratase